MRVVVLLAVTCLFTPAALAIPRTFGDVNPPAHKRAPGLRITGSDDQRGKSKRLSSLRLVTRSTPNHGRIAHTPLRFDPHVRPVAAKSYHDEPYGVESIPDEAIRVDRRSGDYIGSGYVGSGDVGGGDDYENRQPCDQCSGYHAPGAGHHGHWTPIENMVAKSWDHDTVGESWLTRPYYFGGFLGAMFGDDLVNNEISQREGFFGGVRLGWDFTRTWSVEGRLAGAAMPVRFFGREGRDNADVVLGDLDLLWHPWGDTPWRPYVLFGFGFAQFQYRGIDNNNYDKTVFGVPWGIGFRHRWTPKWSCRLELLDNVAFGGSELIETMHNVTLSGGIEYRFGGSHRTYWPWDPGREHW